MSSTCDIACKFLGTWLCEERAILEAESSLDHWQALDLRLSLPPGVSCKGGMSPGTWHVSVHEYHFSKHLFPS